MHLTVLVSKQLVMKTDQNYLIGLCGLLHSALNLHLTCNHPSCNYPCSMFILYNNYFFYENMEKDQKRISNFTKRQTET